MDELHAYIAHRRESDGTPQSVKEHVQGVAELAAGFAGRLGLAKHGELIGLLHDLGKYSKAFQDYISEGETADESGKVDHSTAGAQFVWRALAERGVPCAAAAQLLA
ncbi:MAG: CRISPR-associated endonuclease Cas3'', partial [Acidobacteria bacterium]|nr:CRISPR-associated endonuclease Cas3'' [Acidobacteriota bacterium]